MSARDESGTEAEAAAVSYGVVSDSSPPPFCYRPLTPEEQAAEAAREDPGCIVQ